MSDNNQVPTPQAQTEALLPGRDRPLDYAPVEGDPFFIDTLLFECLLDIKPHIWCATLPLITLRELTMLQWMDELTDEPQWNLKINDETLVNAWKEEVLASDKDITESMADWCIAELQDKASLIPSDLSLNPPPVVVYNGDVVKSDNSLSLEFTEAFKNAICDFENRTGFMKGKHDLHWQPGSDGMVSNLVHPDLFPLVYGRTRVLERNPAAGYLSLNDCVDRCGEGSTLELTIENANLDDNGLPVYSKKFQWLPCEVDISGDTPRITSYINSLHPIHEKTLYTSIEGVVKASIPLWELTLAPLGRSIFFNWFYSERILYDQVLHEYGNEEGDSDDDDDDDDSEEESDTDYSHFGPIDGPLILPDVDRFSPRPKPPPLSFKEAYGAHGLQVVVKIQNIELTPQKPLYEQDSFWNCEDRRNERIVATSIYSYSNHNITSPRLAFRQFFKPKDVEESIVYQPGGDHTWLSTIFGCQRQHQDPELDSVADSDYFSTQEVGSVEMSEGRVISFPNTLQHCVGPIWLEDETQRGWCKLVTLFLVDPNVKIISTKHVPCQRQDWWWRAGNGTTTNSNSNSTESAASSTSPPLASLKFKFGLPVELEDLILSYVDFPLGLQDARTIRDEMISERRELDWDFQNFIERYGWNVDLLINH